MLGSQDLEGPSDDVVARIGIEYRNDLFGHFHATGLTAAPSQYQPGHAASARPLDWPVNAVAASECRDLGATVGYCRPVLLPIHDDDPSLVFDLMPRSVEAARW